MDPQNSTPYNSNGRKANNQFIETHFDFASKMSTNADRIFFQVHDCQMKPDEASAECKMNYL